MAVTIWLDKMPWKVMTRINLRKLGILTDNLRIQAVSRTLQTVNAAVDTVFLCILVGRYRGIHKVACLGTGAPSGVTDHNIAFPPSQYSIDFD